MIRQVFKKVVPLIFFSVLTTQASAVGLGGWLGYNLATDVSTASCDAFGGTCSKGGVSLGGDLWLFGIPALPVKFGIGAAYIPVYNLKYSYVTNSGSGNNNTYSFEYSAKYIPVYAEVRVDIVGFFVGAMVGYGIASVTATQTTTLNNNTTTTTLTSPATASFGIGGFGGYSIGLGPVSIDFGARLYSFSGSFNLMPFIGAKFEI